MAKSLAIFTAICCALLAILYFLSTQTNASLTTQVTALRATSQQQAVALATAEKTRDQLQQQLLQLDVDLGATKTKLNDSEATRIQLARELNATRNDLRLQTEQAAQLKVETAQLKIKLAAAPPVTLETLELQAQQIARLEAELAEARQATTTLAPTLSTQRIRTTTVVSVGPANAFVIINYGAAQGALPALKILIQRGTETVGVALISDVRDQYSIAQVDPQSLRGALHKGDSAVIAP